MKRNLTHLLWVALLALAVPLPGLAQQDTTAQPVFTKGGIEKARLDVQTGKQRYVPGEVVTLRVLVTNTSGAPILLDANSGVSSGLLKVYIARGDGPFKEYIGPRWGISDVAYSGVVEVAPGGAYALDVTLLYNQTPETKHLSGLYAKRLNAMRVEEAYALAEPGPYRIKAVLYNADFSQKIESEPVQVRVDEPKGEERAVWEELKTDPEYGYFIQTGGPKGHPASARSLEIARSLEKLAEAHPRSRQAENIRSSLVHHREMVEQLRMKQLLDAP